jgi:SPP1 family phage portal protein
MKDPSKPNNKVANPFGAYMVDTVMGFFLGKPISYSSDNEELMLRIQDIFDRNHEQNHNSLLGKTLSITGIGYELVYMNELNEIKFANINPQECFMIHDNSIEQNPLVAVRFYDVFDYVSEESTTYVEVYSDVSIRFYKVVDDVLSITDEREHYFGQVPIICYQNNTEFMGDFEKIIDLIDAYDKAISDTANNLEYFADAYLVLSNLDMNEEDITTMKERRVMILGENGKAEWLTKSAQNMEIEAFKDRLREDIHMLSSIPSINDDSFGNATSGEALKYKLFALENFVSIKERHFEKGIEQRLKLITKILNIKGTGQFTHTDVVMSFSRNIPANLAQVTDMIAKLQGIVSNETLISLLPFIDDPMYELSLLDSQNQDTLYTNFPTETTV